MMSEAVENLEKQSQPVVDNRAGASAPQESMQSQIPVQQPQTNPNELSQLKSTLEGLKSIGHKSERMEQIEKQIAEIESGNQGQANHKPETVQNNQGAQEQPVDAQVKQPNQGTQEAPQAESLQESQNPSENSPFYIESEAFGGKKEFGGNKIEEKQTSSFELPDEFVGHIKENYNFDDFSSLENDYKETKTKVVELSKKAEDYDRVANELSSLPKDIQEALDVYSQGGDYSKVFTKQRLNYNLEFQDQDKKKIVDYYFPDGLKAEDWDAADPQSDNYDESGRAERIVDKYIRDAKEKYENDRLSTKSQVEEYQRSIQERADRRNQSLNESLVEFKKMFPEATSSLTDRLYNELKGGAIERMIYNADGSYKKEAIQMLFEMTNGREIRDQLIRQAEERATSRANEKILATQASNRPEFSGTGTFKHEDKYVEEARKDIKKLNDEKFY